MEYDPRDRFDGFEELRFRDDPEDEPQIEPDERTTFDRARFDVFDSDPDTEPDLVFTPEPDDKPDPSSHLETESMLQLPDDPGQSTQPDWLTEPPELEPLDDTTPFELLTLDVFDEDEDELE